MTMWNFYCRMRIREEHSSLWILSSGLYVLSWRIPKESQSSTKKQTLFLVTTYFPLPSPKWNRQKSLPIHSSPNPLGCLSQMVGSLELEVNDLWVTNCWGFCPFQPWMVLKWLVFRCQEVPSSSQKGRVSHTPPVTDWLGNWFIDFAAPLLSLKMLV